MTGKRKVNGARASGMRIGITLAGVLALVLAWSAPLAFAGQASTGQLLFYPCNSCHPVIQVGDEYRAARPLPNNFEGHEIKLIGHDALGKGDAACLACHNDPTSDPGKLKLADGSLIDIKGDIAQVCYRCHSSKYKEWKAGTHGKHKPKCTSGGCHDPHSPQYVYADPLLPFVGNGFQIKVLTIREPFKALAGPVPPPAVLTPRYFSIIAVIAFALVAALIVWLIRGRSKR